MGPNNEPVAWTGAVSALALAGVGVMRSFHVPITEEQSNEIIAFLVPCIGLVTLAIRAKVTPADKAERTIHRAYKATAGADAVPKLSEDRGPYREDAAGREAPNKRQATSRTTQAQTSSALAGSAAD